MIFTNKTSKTWAKFEKKRSSKFVVLVSWAMRKPRHIREMKGKKIIQTDTKSDIIIIHTLSRKEENNEKHSMA